MILPSQEASSTLERDNSQSYSLITQNPSHNLNDRMITESSSYDKKEPNAHINSKKMTITNKKHSHGSSSSRPRSKSWEQHRHYLPVHKKKHPINHKHTPPYHGGRVSPKMSPSSVYRGKMWIRPVAPSLSSKYQVDIKDTPDIMSNHEFITTSSDLNQYPIRQVSSYDDDEIMLLDTLPISPVYDDSSFSNYFGKTKTTSSPMGSKKIPIIFGESGKPIRPRRHVTVT